jgi:type II secretory pathway pseudopilin PulG
MHGMRYSLRATRAFTMLELLVAIGLMVMLLSVLAFVFRQSAQAVTGATETVTIVQRARNFSSRLGKEVAAAVESYLPPDARGKPPRLTFIVSDDGETPLEEGENLEFLSQTLNEGVMDTWCVKYFYSPEKGVGGPDEMGSIRRIIRTRDRFGEPFDKKFDKDERVVANVRKVKFRRVPPPPPRHLVDKMPASVEVIVTFVDQWGGKRFKLEHQFYFPIYQGH